MKKFLMIILTGTLFYTYGSAQVISVCCYSQHDSLPYGGPNLILNGSFETSNCVPDAYTTSSWCPLATAYGCDIPNWTSMGGGSATYCCIVDNNGWSNVGSGQYAVYFGNSFCNACNATTGDISCLHSSGCTAWGPPPGYPYNASQYGGALGLSLYQVVNGLTVGNNYTLQFWAGGENGFTDSGLFAVNVGFGDTMLREVMTPPNTGIGTRFLIEFKAQFTSDTIKFTNWGHVCSSCTELVLDDVALYNAPLDSLPYNAFSASPLAGCAPLTVTFFDSSSAGNIYQWNFGDGNTSSLYNPTHTYIDTGYYTVTLIVINNTACIGGTADTTIKVNYIHVISGPAIAFTADSTIGCSPFTVNFNNTTTGGVSYHWNFGDGGTSNVTNPTHTFIGTGPFTVTLVAYGAFCNDSTTLTIQILTPLPVTANFSADTLTGCNPFTVHFTETNTNATNFKWYFGDGTSDTSANPTHTYTRSGTFTDTLIGYTNVPCGRVADTVIKISYINVINPQTDSSSFTEANISGCQPLTVTFTNSSYNAQSYLWTFGDGWQDTSKNPTHIYFDTGSYAVTLIVFRADSVCKVAPDTSIFEFVIVDSCNLYIPNVFSPNGDGKNEYFYLDASGYTNYHLVIYNRWGEKLFESTDSKILWNGKINNTGADAPDGTYYYIFSANDPGGKPYKSHGYLTLIR
jgi:gliding motility-associated-like protein